MTRSARATPLQKSRGGGRCGSCARRWRSPSARTPLLEDYLVLVWPRRVHRRRRWWTASRRADNRHYRGSRCVCISRQLRRDSLLEFYWRCQLQVRGWSATECLVSNYYGMESDNKHTHHALVVADTGPSVRPLRGRADKNISRRLLSFIASPQDAGAGVA